MRKATLRDLYLPGWYEYLAQSAAGLVPWAPITDLEAEQRAIEGADAMAAGAAAGPGGFAEHLDEVPALILVLADLRKLATVDRGPTTTPSWAGPRSIPSCGACCWRRATRGWPAS